MRGEPGARGSGASARSDGPAAARLDQRAAAGNRRRRRVGAGNSETTISPPARRSRTALRNPASRRPGARIGTAAPAARQHREVLDVEPEADGRAVAAEDRADLVVAAAARDRIAGARGVGREAGAAVVRVAARIGEVEADRGRADGRDVRCAASRRRSCERRGDARRDPAAPARPRRARLVAVQADQRLEPLPCLRREGGAEASGSRRRPWRRARRRRRRAARRRPARRRARRGRCARRRGRGRGPRSPAPCRHSSARSRISRSASRPVVAVDLGAELQGLARRAARRRRARAAPGRSSRGERRRCG